MSLACFVTACTAHIELHHAQCHLLPRDVHAQRYLIKSSSPITLLMSYTTPARTATRLALALRLGSDSSSKCSPISPITDANPPSANRPPLGMRRRLSSLLAPFSSKHSHTVRLYSPVAYAVCHLSFVPAALFTRLYNPALLSRQRLVVSDEGMLTFHQRYHQATHPQSLPHRTFFHRATEEIF